ncbi:MAG: hypothetical protein LBH58_08435 [Tannerellaceae bacterium]|jgi:hypothetical protein|nr:hypothetical protein [Tannerellaceae bacterium]
MKHIYTLILSSISLCIFYGCVEDPELPGIINGGKPAIELDTIMDVTASSVRVFATILKQNGSPVTERGFSWTDEKGNAKRLNVIGKKENSSIKLDTIITGLEKETYYTFTAYAKNEIDEAISNSIKEQTGNGLGQVRTLKPDSIKGTSVYAGGLIINKGESEIKERGVYLSREKEVSEIDSIYKTSLQVDSFVFKLDSLKPNTTYYIKSFVKNDFGTFSGNIETFTTLSGKPKFASFKITGTGFVDASFDVEIEDEGDKPITIWGICWSESPNPTISNDTIHINTDDKSYSGTINGLKSQVAYYARAFAINSVGTEYSDEFAFVTVSNMPEIETGQILSMANGAAMITGSIKKIGMGNIDVYGFCYSTNPNPAIINLRVDLPIEGQLEGPFSGSITKLNGNTTYYVKAFLKNTSGLIAYGEQIVINTPSMFTQMASFTESVRLPNSSATFTNNSIGYLVGGDLGSKNTNELMAYNSLDNRWDKLASMPGTDSERKGLTAVTVNNVAYIFGGIDKASTLTNKLYRYYPNYNTWETVPSSGGPDPIQSAIGCSIGNMVYFIGGCRDTISNEVWSFETTSSSWTRKANFPVKQYGGIAVNIDGVVYAGLGLNNLSGTSSNKRLWKSVDNMNTWMEVASLSNGGIVRGAVVLNNSIYAVDNTGSLWLYNVEENKWYEKTKLPSTHRRDVQHCMFMLNDMIYIGLGESYKTLYEYNPTWDN